MTNTHKQAERILKSIKEKFGLNLNEHDHSDVEYLKSQLENFLDLDIDLDEVSNYYDDEEELDELFI